MRSWFLRLLSLFTFAALPAAASDVMQCSYTAEVTDAAKPIADDNGRPQVHVGLRITALARAGGHNPARCEEGGFKAGATLDADVLLAAAHHIRYLTVGATVGVTFTEVWNFMQGPNGEVQPTHSAEWTLDTPTRPYAELSGVAGPDTSLPSAADMSKALDAFIAAHPDRRLSFAVKGTALRTCGGAEACPPPGNPEFYSVTAGGVQLTFAVDDHVPPSKAASRANMVIHNLSVDGVALRGWEVTFGSYSAFVSGDPGRIPGLQVKGSRLVGTLHIALDWLSAQKSGDRFCTAPSGMMPPADVCGASRSDIKFAVDIAVDVDFASPKGPKSR